MDRLPTALLAALVALLALAGNARAQIAPRLPIDPPALPGVRDLPVPGDVDRFGRGTIDRVLAAPQRLTRLVRQSRGALETDPDGWPVVRGEVLTVGLSPEALARAREAGFTVLRTERLDELQLSIVVLAPPPRLGLSRAVERLRDWDPAAEITFNHVHAVAGDAGPPPPAGSTLAGSTGQAAPGARMGLIDSGAAAHASLAGLPIVQRGFAGPAAPGAHGTAVASLMVGRSGAFNGAAPGGALLIADVYGGRADGGAATALVRALDWMTGEGVRVVNISLVGPRNPVVEQAVAAARARGVVIVAAVGNDGPAAPPLYPAAYPGVIGVTAVTGRDRALPEAARGDQVDFAAPGADMAAAGPDGDWRIVRGTSFAAPLAAGLIARRGGDAQAVEALAGTARDLGDPGRDGTYGRGLVGSELRVAPNAVGARRNLSR